MKQPTPTTRGHVETELWREIALYLEIWDVIRQPVGSRKTDQKRGDMYKVAHLLLAIAALVGALALASSAFAAPPALVLSDPKE